MINTATLPHPCTPHPRTPRAPTLPQPHQADAGEIAQPSQVQNHRNAAVETCEKSVKSSPTEFSLSRFGGPQMVMIWIYPQMNPQDGNSLKVEGLGSWDFPYLPRNSSCHPGGDDCILGGVVDQSYHRFTLTDLHQAAISWWNLEDFLILKHLHCVGSDRVMICAQISKQTKSSSADLQSM